MTARDVAEHSIARHEGNEQRPYKCPAGLWSVGKGINVESMPIPSYLVTIGDLMDWITDPVLHENWFQQRLDRAMREATTFAGDAWEGLSEARQAVLCELAYWLGYPRLSGFKRFRAAFQAGHWIQAESELLDSRLHRQVPGRTRELASRFLEG